MGFTIKKRREESKTDVRLRWDVYNGGTGASGEHSETLVQINKKRRMKERKKEGGREERKEGKTDKNRGRWNTGVSDWAFKYWAL